jgi:chemotaxis signal transduction protein
VLALVFHAHGARYAIRASLIERVLPDRILRPAPALAPPAVLGLLREAEDLVPVIDSLHLLGERHDPTPGAWRIVLCRLPTQPPRRIAIRVRDAFELTRFRVRLLRLALGQAAFLGDFLDGEGEPQLVELEQVLPAELAALARALPGASA